MRGADLRGADLKGAKLRGAVLYNADLCGADLTKASLTAAESRGADLTKANLRDACLREAGLTEDNLRQAKLRNANLRPRLSAGSNSDGPKPSKAPRSLTGSKSKGVYLLPFTAVDDKGTQRAHQPGRPRERLSYEHGPPSARGLSLPEQAERRRVLRRLSHAHLQSILAHRGSG